MKRKLLCAILLFLCFTWLAFLSGVIPVMTEAEAASLEPENVPAGDEPEPTPPEETAPAESLPPEETPPPSDTPEPTPDAAPAEAADSAPDIAVVATTITADGLLDNDTYYNVDTDALLGEGPPITLPAEGYQILIVHTHTTEAYLPTAEDPYEGADYRTTDPAHSVVRVGDALAEALAQYGLRVLHDTELYDFPSYNGSYARSGAAIEEYLAAYPGIQIVIDLHRDALGDDSVVYKTLADIDGIMAAQLMFVMGTDVNLEHPNWRDNLRLALTLQTAVTARYPTLMRPTVLCDYRYNQQLTPGSLLLEVGTCGNTLEEAVTGVERFAEIAGPLLASWVEQ